MNTDEMITSTEASPETEKLSLEVAEVGSISIETPLIDEGIDWSSPVEVAPLELKSETFEASFAPVEDLEMSDELRQDLGTIPDKMEFKIGEVADLVGVKPYVLRYWESEFDVLKPKKSKHNQRMYSHKDVEMVFMIKQLLYRDRFSIEGAQAALKKLKVEVKKELQKEKEVQKLSTSLDRFRSRLDDLLSSIQRTREKFRTL